MGAWLRRRRRRRIRLLRSAPPARRLCRAARGPQTPDPPGVRVSAARLSVMTLTLFSANDHFVEPADLFVGRLPAKIADRAPALAVEDGFLTWRFEGARKQISALLAHVGLPDDWDEKRISWSGMRPGCYDPAERLKDMDVDGVFASILFPTFPGFGGEMFMASNDGALALACVRAWHDCALDEWGAAAPEGFVPFQ